MKRVIHQLGRLVVLALASCGGDRAPRAFGWGSDGVQSADDGAEGSDTEGLATETTTDAGSAGAGDGVKLDVPNGDEPENPDNPDETCATYREMTELGPQPADIIFIVDNSFSMLEEAVSVQNNLNAFSQQIAQSGVDARVVLISTLPLPGELSDVPALCIEPPLGSGGCSQDPPTDNNPPRFTHIDQIVDSNDALVQLIEHYPDWMTILRPHSGLHIVVVSDDDSEIDGAPLFDAEFIALNPDFSDYTLHGIVGARYCREVDQIGQVYIDLAEMTGGIIGDLCDQDFQPVFDRLATQVVAESGLSCQWPLPAPPAGQVLNPNEVNVDFDDGTGTSETIGHVDDLSGCQQVASGWYYDDPITPTSIIACPQTCARIQDASMASISVTLGCATIPAG